ncbi:macro domain-like protein [Coniophora puteana RWD-64-598 SS2]|uniref:Macro domain-like protein n=1 Tax=Coniophora puteana (strain RWD-64-598) TaxID=741705 RepID=A0A5M3MYA0_CONPW|nr:macro domain-like protein [Coniophora puteana RWD-64-598 SS2]EIW84112.1 macro domain-like protein [Coniophora puteana RWD-64-598 SS2]
MQAFRRSSIPLAEVKTLRQLYEAGDLRAPAKSEYKPAFLDKVSLHLGDITKLQVDAIVNAANSGLQGGGGVDGSIHRAAGPGLKAELREKYVDTAKAGSVPCPTGEVRISTGHELPSKYVIHAVGPSLAWNLRGPPAEDTKLATLLRDPTSASEGKIPAALLASCYQNSLEVMVENKLKHIAFPCISTGIYGYPIVEATEIALHTIRTFLSADDHADKVERVIFVLFDKGPDSERDIATYRKLLPHFFPQESDTSHA